MKRIAVLVDYLNIATYQQEVVEGFIAGVPDDDTELYFFLGGPFLKDRFNPFVSANNTIYERISKDMFSGIVVCSAVTNYLADDEVKRFLEPFAEIPIVFIGSAPDGFARVQTDNRSGMGSVVRHFILDHGRRHIAFIAGRSGTPWAEERFAAYREQLESAGLPFEPELVVTGGFEPDDGIEAVRILIDERQARFDAVIGCNDLVALGAKLELEKRGLNVPGDIALGGYDDSLEASCVIPSLTTVRPPYSVIAAKAFTVLDQLRSGMPPSVYYLPGEPIFRQSCGCLLRTADDTLLACRRATAQAPAVFYAQNKGECLREFEVLLSPFGCDIRQAGFEACLDAVFRLLTEKDWKENFFIPIQKLVWHFLSHKMKVETCHDVFSRIRRFFSPLCTTRADMERAEIIFHKIRLAISDVQTIQNFQNLILNWKQTGQVSQVSHDLFGTVETTGFREEIYRSFPVFNIRDFLFAEYPIHGGPEGKAKVIALIHAGTADPLKEDVFFPPQRLFPGPSTLFESPVRFVLPVTYGENSLGFTIFGKITRDKPRYAARAGNLTGSPYYEKLERLPPLYSPLTRELGKTFYISRLLSMHKADEAALQKLAQNLEARNQELEDFTRIASHDLKEPLRKIAYLSERLKSALSERATAVELSYLERLESTVFRMSGLINGLLAYSRVSTCRESFAPVDLSWIIAEVISDLEVLIRETGGKVETSALPEIEADSLLMRELFLNLIGNGLKYHRHNVPPVVVVKAKTENGFLELTVSDNGIGFEQKYGELIFGLFQRAVKKTDSEGTGIGLTICKKIVERHHGTIQAFGEPDRGATFVIRLPIKASAPTVTDLQTRGEPPPECPKAHV